MIDLAPTAARVSALVDDVRDDRLGGPTPCPEMDVAGLLQHVLGLTAAFRDAAGKLDGPTTSMPPAPSTDPLPDGWRDTIRTRLAELADAWTEPGAWDGMTKAGGVELPGEVAGLVALDELLIHGWDLAVAIGVPYAPSDAEAEAVLPIVTPSEDDGGMRDAIFGPVVPVPADAPLFDRVLGLAGRDPAWRPGA